jgi:murein L,D-transpeptidase YcbB/YkuD
MNRWKAGTLSLLIIAFALTGCAKKSTEQASITGTGFDSSTSTEELAQLPQASTSTPQQAGVEVLPIETSPITQGIPPIAGPASIRSEADTASSIFSGSLTREQQIQTALKAAGLYNGSIDGKIGPATKRAIEQFQSQNSLKVDGKVGPQTWAALERYLASTGTSTTTVD